MAEVTNYYVTGSWRHIVDDGMVDLDSEPDVVNPTGHVVFTPQWPSLAVAGSPAVTYSVGVVKALIADGELRDVQGRVGVWLPGKIGTQVIRWKAETYLNYNSQKIDYPDLVFDLSGNAHLTALIENNLPGQPPIVIDPRIEGLVIEAEATLLAMMGYVAGLNASAQTATDKAAEAAASALAAAGSASASSSSASNAAVARTNAQTYANAALGHRDAAEGFRNETEGFRDTASGHATAASGSAAAAAGSAASAATSATSFGLSATTATGAPGSNAAVTVSGTGPAYTLGFTVPRGDTGNPGPPGEVSTAAMNAALAALKSEILGGAGAAWDTLQELRDLYASSDATLQGLIDLKANLTDPRFTDSRTPTTHTHSVTDMTATGTRSSATYLRGDNTWATPTTYAVLTQAVADTGTATTAQSISAAVLKGAIWQRVTGSSTTPVTSLGQSLNTVASAAAARTLIGAGTSDLAIGVTSTTAKAGNWMPDISEVINLNTALGSKVGIMGATSVVWLGTEAEYTALPSATKNAAGFIAVVRP